MNLQEVKQQIKKYQGKIDDVPDSEETFFDDIKEVEINEWEIISLIFNYCVAQGYNYKGFPDRYAQLIEDDDPDFYDFLTYEVKDYFVHLVALEHEDVFELIQLYAMGYEQYEDGFDMEEVKTTIAIYGREVSLEFNRSDWS